MIQGLQARFDEACREFNKADSERLSLQEHVQLLQRQAEETRKAHLQRVEELMQQRDLLDLDHAAHRKICEPRIALLEQELETMEGDREEFQGRARDLEQQLQKATRDRDEYKHTAAQVLADKAAMDAEMKKASADVHKAQEIKMRPLAAGELPSTGTILVVRTEGLCLPCLFLTLCERWRVLAGAVCGRQQAQWRFPRLLVPPTTQQRPVQPRRAGQQARHAGARLDRTQVRHRSPRPPAHECQGVCCVAAVILGSVS